MIARRVALLGTFDVDNFGDHLFPLVARHELSRRLSGVVVDAFAPMGSRAKPTPLDLPGAVVEPLERWSSSPSKYDLVLVGGGEILHRNDAHFSNLYGRLVAPSRSFVGADVSGDVAWNAVGAPFDFDGPIAAPAYAAVRDPHSLARVRAAGVTDAIIVPDTGLLLDRTFDGGRLDDQLTRLRRSHCYPASGGALVVQGCDLLVPFVGPLADQLTRWLDVHPWLSLVLLETGRCRGDRAFSDAFAAAAGRHVYRMPRSAGLEDVVAAVRGAAAFVGSSLHGTVTAFVHGRPFVVLNPHGESKLDGFGAVAGVEQFVVHDVAAVPGALDGALIAAPELSATRLPPLQQRVDEHFDRLASLVVAASESSRRRGRLRAMLHTARAAIA